MEVVARRWKCTSFPIKNFNQNGCLKLKPYTTIYLYFSTTYILQVARKLEPIPQLTLTFTPIANLDRIQDLIHMLDCGRSTHGNPHMNGENIQTLHSGKKKFSYLQFLTIHYDLRTINIDCSYVLRVTF